MQQLLRPGDPPPFSLYNEAGKAPLLLLCDHASKAVPKALGDLGITDEELSRHIGWDIGGLDAAIELSQALDAPLLASGYSRLVIDCNRWPGGEGSTPEVSDGTPVPANRGLTKEQVDARAEACFWPYHRAVDRQLDRMTAGGRSIAMLVMHSFTPEMNGFKRPWHVGVLWNEDPRLPEPCWPNCGAMPRSSSATTSPIRRGSPTNTRSPPMRSRGRCRIARWRCGRT
jgi:predicted N-formylglutamate amidohydrolase